MPILKDIHFTIKAGSTFAILGGTGSGKSTLMHLLDRLYELPKEGGTISIGGTDIRTIRLSYLRKISAWFCRSRSCFPGPSGKTSAQPGPARTWKKSAMLPVLPAWMMPSWAFSGGYDTIVGERGVTLSGGQKQRVAIARMLMQRAPIMVFDDSPVSGRRRNRRENPQRVRPKTWAVPPSY